MTGKSYIYFSGTGVQFIWIPRVFSWMQCCE